MEEIYVKWLPIFQHELELYFKAVFIQLAHNPFRKRDPLAYQLLNLQGNRGPMSVIMDILALLMQCSVFFIITRYQTRDKTFLTDLVDMVHVVAAMVLISLRQVKIPINNEMN